MSRHPQRWGQVALMLAAFALFFAVLLFYKIDSEGKERRDQACQGAEGKHLEEVKQLRRTYDYFVHPPPGFEKLLKDPRTIQQLHEAEKAAKNDGDQFGEFVPAYCDEPGIGRPEPDPTLPHKPAGVP